MADIRACEQCGSAFAPRREHARFCSARCRLAWNRAQQSDPAVQLSALEWSVTAMRDVTDRLARVKAADRQRAFALVGEAVWWVTIVDGTLVRHHPETYDCVMATRPPAERPLIEGTLSGLRFVRNQMGQHADHADFIAPAADGGPGGERRISAWTWKPVPEPVLASLSQRGQAWEMTRYQDYEAHLQGRTIGETFSRAAEFLNPTVARAMAPVEETAASAEAPAVPAQAPAGQAAADSR
jgi:hypothetical protein